MTDGAGNRRYFSYDGLGSTVALTDAAGTVTDTYSYDVFGAVRARTGTNASPWKFTGEQEDGAAGDSGYYFLRARYYDASLGRFVSRDPLEFDQRYAYASGNPMLHADPSGKCSDGEGCGWCPTTTGLGRSERCSYDVNWDHTLVTFDSAYVDLNYTACAVMCVTAGLMWDEKGAYWYLGTGLGAGGGWTLSLGPGQSVSPGLNCGVSASAPGAAVQWGMDLQGLMAVDGPFDHDFYEGGIAFSATPAISDTCYVVAKF